MALKINVNLNIKATKVVFCYYFSFNLFSSLFPTKSSNLICFLFKVLVLRMMMCMLFFKSLQLFYVCYCLLKIAVKKIGTTTWCTKNFWLSSHTLPWVLFNVLSSTKHFMLKWYIVQHLVITKKNIFMKNT